MSEQFSYETSYGKCRVPVYRAYGTPLRGLTSIPESPFQGRSNILMAFEVDVEVFGQNFLPAYTEGDNSMVVATDSLKNIVLGQALAYKGATIEGFLALLGHEFLGTYADMHEVQLTGRELPFAAATVAQSQGFGPSDLVFGRSHGDYASATLRFQRTASGIAVSEHRCGRIGLQLLKVSGSAFTSFVRDGYTTLPERGDRPLFVFLDVHWRYGDTADMLNDMHSYVAAEQVRDLVATVFHEFVSESIQHLVHAMGRRLLERFPQLVEVAFEGQNRTRDPVAASETEPQRKVYSDPFPAFGEIKLTMRRA